MLSRIKAPFKKRRKNSDLKYLQFTRGFNYKENGDDDRDDASSIFSVSTNATMDNIPGTGRIIDKCIYQFFGRKLERAIFRISMANLSPDRIVQFLWVEENTVFHTEPKRMDYVVKNIGRNEDIAGLKSLVKQTQSNSLYRSAAALSALIRLSTSTSEYSDFYVSVAAAEPIFHLESLANALDDSHPEKKYFLFLIAIGRAYLHFHDIEAPEITKEFAINCRQKLLEILDSSRLPSHDPLAVIFDACLLFVNVSSNIHWYSPVVDSLIETVYYLLTFLVRFPIDLYQTIYNMHPLQRLILFTYSRWLGSVTDYIIDGLKRTRHLPQLLPICAFSFLHRIIGDMQYGSLSLRHIPQNLFPLHVFPRRIRNSTPQEDNPIILQSSISIWTTRTRRLLASPDELRRAAGDSMRLEYGWLSNKLYNLPPEEKSKEEWQRSLDRARSIQVVESDLTRGFLEARQAKHWDPTGIFSWQYYNQRLRKRHRIGEYCRSNLDWEWDTSSSLKRLFRIDRPKSSPQPDNAVHRGFTALPATIHSGSNKDISDVTILEKGSNLRQTIRVRYETETGEVKYKMFYAGPSTEDIPSGADVGSDARISSAQETGSLTGQRIEASGEVSEAGSGDEMKNTEVEDEHEELRWLRKQNGVSDAEDDSISVDTRNRPQYNSRTDDWLETQVCVPTEVVKSLM